MADLGDNIRWHRSRLRLSQAALARELDVRAATISDWERNAYPPSDTNMVGLVRVFGITEAELREGNPRTGGTNGGSAGSAVPAELPRQLRILAGEFEVEALRLGANDEEMAYVRQALQGPEAAKMFAYGYVEREGVSNDAIVRDYKSLIDGLRKVVEMRVDKRERAKRHA